MKIPGLRNRILLGAVAIAIVVALSSLVAASWVIARQYLEQSDVHLRKASQIIGDSLAERKAALSDASHKLAAQRNLGSTIWYLSQYAQSNVDPDLLLSAYRQLAGEISAMGNIPELSRVAIYDSSGRLVAFVFFGNTGNELGFVEQASSPIIHLATLMPGEEFTREKLRLETRTRRIEPIFGGPLPQKDSVRFTVIDGLVAIESDAPIMGETFDPKTGKPEIRQLGLVSMVQPLGQPFIDRLAKLTDTAINIFTPTGFTNGHMASYRNLDVGGSEAAAAPEFSHASSITEITIDGANYYQGRVPLYNGEMLVGSIVSLRSQDIVQGSIWAMTKALGLIAASSLLLILPLSWYFATSLARPLGVLARVFRGVASNRESASLRDERDRLAREKVRDDELGDLTQSFVAMEQAIAQKIQQISDLNFSLEKKVQERTAALMTSEQELRTVLDNTPDTIARYDGDGRRIYVNPAFIALVEGGEANLLGKKPSEFPGGSHSELYESKIVEVFNTGHNEQFELKWPGKNGTETCSHIRLTAERDPSGAVVSVLAVGRDITELNNYRNQLVQKELAKTQFLAVMSHEIRTPMNGILGMAQLLLAPRITEEDRREYARIIMSSGQILLTLLNDILDLSKIEAGRLELELIAFSPEQLLEEVRTLFAEQAHAKGLTIETAWAGTSGAGFRGDPIRLRQMLSNLVSNAIKFTTDGFVHIEGREIVTPDGSMLEFSVSDSGIGIPESKRALLFEPFSQLDASTTRKYGGTGLGLSIVRDLARLMQGNVGASSNEGKGSRFWFRIRADRLSMGEERRQVERDAGAEGAPMPDLLRNSGYVLVVEDNRTNRKVIETLLAKHGLRFETVENGADAVGIVTSGAVPELVLMDCQMPVMDGLEATAAIRKWERETGRPRLPIVAITAGAFPEDRERCIAVGMDDFLTKPLQVKELSAILDKWMAACRA